MNDLRLTQDGDLYFSVNGDVELTQSVIQAIAVRLRWFLGEWRINTNYGIPYYDEILVKNPSMALLDDRIRTEILSVDGVESIESLDISIDKKTRKCSISFAVIVNEGSLAGGGERKCLNTALQIKVSSVKDTTRFILN